MANTENLEAPQSLGAILLRSCQRYAYSAAYLVPSKTGVTKITYLELEGHVRRWASGVKSLGLERGDVLCILSENSLEWALLDWACQTLGVVVVPIYPTLPSDQAQYIVENCHAKVVACGDEAQAKKLSEMHNIRIFLLKNGNNSLELMSSQAPLIEKEEWIREISKTSGADTATIIYTSGTTGPPKGVVLTHSNFLWMNQAVAKGFAIGEGDVFFSFLPLSHVYARANDHFLPISLGSAIGLNRSLSSLAADISQIRPTLMLVVPRFLDSMRDRISEGARKGSKIQTRLFEMTVNQGKRKVQGQSAPLHSFLKKVVGSKIQARLGGRLRFFVSGGAALPSSTFAFYESFGVLVLQGYGLTETTSGIYINYPDRPNRSDSVGEPLDGVETKIAEDGEILVRGPFLMKEYFELPTDTRAAIDEEGWFHTGDVGRLEGSHLIITDRKKDLIVLANGKNVAPQPIENLLRQGKYISEAVVLGDGLDGCVALIVPNFEALRADLHLQESTLHLIELETVKHAVKADVDLVNAGLASFEKIKRHALIPEPFTIEGGELTPSLKVKRKFVSEKYRDTIAYLAR